MLLVIVITPPPDVDRIQGVLNVAHSWYRIAGNSWIVCTPEDSLIWTRRLAEHVRPQGNVFIARLRERERQGWMPVAFWNWFNAHTDDL